jgi:hypothetical protein
MTSQDRSATAVRIGHHRGPSDRPPLQPDCSRGRSPGYLFEDGRDGFTNRVPPGGPPKSTRPPPSRDHQMTSQVFETDNHQPLSIAQTLSRGLPPTQPTCLQS